MKLMELTVKNVRGLPDLHLQLDAKNLVIWGPNGSGKSCVVDAIDFLFTGQISRLMGEGTGGITLARHGHHIDHDSESAVVTATVLLDGIPGPVKITRCMAQPDVLLCSEEARPQLDDITVLMRRGGVVLTRRDILRYVAAEAAKRSNEIQELLHLRGVDDIRKSLQRARNALRQLERAAQKAIETAMAEVNVTLGQTNYRDESLVEMVNECRRTLGSGLLSEHKSTAFKEGLSPPAVVEGSSASSNPNLFQRAIQNILQGIKSELIPEYQKHEYDLRNSISKLRADPTLLAEIDRLELSRYAARFVEHSTVECPVCGAPWTEGHLKAHIESKIATAQAAERVRKSIVEAAEGLSNPARNLRANVDSLENNLRTADLGTSEEDLQVLTSWRGRLYLLLEALENPITKYLDCGFSTNDVVSMLVPLDLHDLLGRIETTVQAALPKPSAEQTAWDTLTRLEESVRALESRKSEKKFDSLYSTRSTILLETYEQARHSVLEGLYSRISDRFVEFYCVLHDHEKEHFGAQLQPQGPSLAFEVDFLGRGTHPPHALHSEGHQDSMGVCLFLALNEELAKEKISLIVLDDVVMSVDTGHRKDVCRLLRERFPDRQFVITTHDKTWAKQLQQERVVEASRVTQFTGWTVEGGPNTHRQMDLWETIQAELEKEDVASAAFQLRRGSEDFFETVCDKLGAKLVYNAGMQWQLDDWLFAAMEEYKSLLKRGKSVASSWGNQEAVYQFVELESLRSQIYGRTYAEQWAINANVHFNSWANMSKQDFIPVVQAFKDLHALFRCSNCKRFLEKVPRKGTLQSATCPCGATNWNLRHKS